MCLYIQEGVTEIRFGKIEFLYMEYAVKDVFYEEQVLTTYLLQH